MPIFGQLARHNKNNEAQKVSIELGAALSGDNSYYSDTTTQVNAALAKHGVNKDMDNTGRLSMLSYIGYITHRVAHFMGRLYTQPDPMEDLDRTTAQNEAVRQLVPDAVQPPAIADGLSTAAFKELDKPRSNSPRLSV